MKFRQNQTSKSIFFFGYIEPEFGLLDNFAVAWGMGGGVSPKPRISTVNGHLAMGLN